MTKLIVHGLKSAEIM